MMPEYFTSTYVGPLLRNLALKFISMYADIF